MRKAARHETLSTRYPPSTGPKAAVMPENPDHVPIALPRRASSKEALMIASDPGTSIAPPTPCIARATMSCPGVTARPHPTEATAKSTMPKE